MTEYPTVPAHSGPRLAARVSTENGGVAGCWIPGLWVLIGGLFIGVHLANPQPESPQVLLAFGLFALVGLGMIAVLTPSAGRLLAAGLAGSVVVEVDAQPFVPGGSYRGRVSQVGLCRLTRLGVELAYEEAATYETATNVRTYRKVLSRAGAGGSVPLDFAVAVPAGAMHSFKTTHNEIAWALRVSGRVLRVFPYRQSYQVVVRPGAEDGE